MKFVKSIITVLFLTLAAEAKHVRNTEQRQALELGPEAIAHKNNLFQRPPDGKGALAYDPSKCVSEQTAFGDCLTSLGQSLADGPCITCWRDVGSDGRTSFADCEDFEDYFCGYYILCLVPCNNLCVTEMIAYDECYFDQNVNGLAPCFFDCDFPSPTTNPLDCDTDLRQCISNCLDGDPVGIFQ